MSKSQHHIQTARFIANDRYHCNTIDTSGPQPLIVSSYSYPHHAVNGQVADLPGYPSTERSLCIVRNHRDSSTVNGICLRCATAAGKVV